MVKYLDKENFEDIINEEKVLIDFYAEWCGPCKMMGKILEDNDFQIPVWKVNTDSFGDLAQKYGVMSIPTLILFKNGKIINQNVGFMSKSELDKFIKEND